MERLNLNQIKNSAFGQWSRNQSRVNLATHLVQCLGQEKSNNIVWRLVELLGIEKLNVNAIFTMVDFLQGSDSK